MNAIQKKVFQLFKMFVQICDRLQMEYFMLCGSALGAIKYGGFIPWDDDIDVGLYREDYERFCKEAPMLLPKNFSSKTTLRIRISRQYTASCVTHQLHL